jgi:hypothetical protein
MCCISALQSSDLFCTQIRIEHIRIRSKYIYLNLIHCNVNSRIGTLAGRQLDSPDLIYQIDYKIMIHFITYESLPRNQSLNKIIISVCVAFGNILIILFMNTIAKYLYKKMNFFIKLQY